MIHWEEIIIDVQEAREQELKQKKCSPFLSIRHTSKKKSLKPTRNLRGVDDKIRRHFSGNRIRKKYNSALRDKKLLPC